MKRMVWALLSGVILMGAVSCNSTTGTSQKVSEFVHAEILFPDNLQTRIMDRDTNVSISLDGSYKLVVYMNSTSCDGSHLKELLSWKYYMEELRALCPRDSLHYVFIFHPKEVTALVEGLKLYVFDIPVWVDEDGEFERVNSLPEDPVFHTFLLDRDHRVVLVGSPVGRPKMWKLYKETLAQFSAKESGMSVALSDCKKE